MPLAKMRKVMRVMGSPVLHENDAEEEFEAYRVVSTSFAAGDPLEDRSPSDNIVIILPAEVYAELGMSKTITLSLEPGDKLNEEDDG